MMKNDVILHDDNKFNLMYLPGNAKNGINRTSPPKAIFPREETPNVKKSFQQRLDLYRMAHLVTT